MSSFLVFPTFRHNNNLTDCIFISINTKYVVYKLKKKHNPCFNLIKAIEEENLWESNGDSVFKVWGRVGKRQFMTLFEKWKWSKVWETGFNSSIWWQNRILHRCNEYIIIFGKTENNLWKGNNYNYSILCQELCFWRHYNLLLRTLFSNNKTEKKLFIIHLLVKTYNRKINIFLWKQKYINNSIPTT